MRLVVLLVVGHGLAACGELTDLGECAEATPDWWPVGAGNRWLYREFEPDTTDPFLLVNPDVKWKEQLIVADDVEIQGLAGTDRGFQMRSIDELDHEWDYSYFVHREGGFRWAAKRLYPNLDFPPAFPLDPSNPGEERLYTPARRRFDYSGERVCLGSQWRDEWVQHHIRGEDAEPLEDEPDPCPRATLAEDPWSCDVWEDPEGSTQWVAAIDATVSLFADRVFHEDALCLRRLDDDLKNNSLYCWVRGIGKVLECEWDHLGESVIKVEELCLHCAPGEECEWTAEDGRVCDTGEVCDWSREDGGACVALGTCDRIRAPPPRCLSLFWEARSCDDLVRP